MTEVDPAKAAAKITELLAEADMHERVAATLHDLASDEEREASRITLQAHKIQVLINEGTP